MDKAVEQAELQTDRKGAHRWTRLLNRKSYKQAERGHTDGQGC
jgi:hypothetical protein